MLHNIGSPDRVIRLVVGLLLLTLPSFVSFGAWGAGGMYVVGAVLIVTAAFAFCPIYAALGLSTRRHRSS
jgi:hypothetical protein